MAEYISFQPSDFFSTTLYTGTGAELAVTGVGFEPNFTWIKDRDGLGYHNLFDTARGATKRVFSNVTNAENTEAQSLKSWQSDGFTVGTHADCNTSGNDIASWNWKAGTTSGLSGGTITPSSYSINTTSGVGIYAYTGTGDTSNTIAHGLGAVPKMMIFKNRDATMDWVVYHEALGNTDYMVLNTTGAAAASTSRWNDTSPTSTLFTIGNTDKLNSSGVDYIGYVFADVKGYSKFGGYTGNANADGPFIYTGFRPAFLLIKRSSGTDNWIVLDNKRLGYNPKDYGLYPNLTSVEDTTEWLDILSNGFKIRTTHDTVNKTGHSYIYMAFAEFPIVSSNDVPTVAR